MGALEYAPATGPGDRLSKQILIDKLVDLASEILTRRNNLNEPFGDEDKEGDLKDILRIGTSAGGVRARLFLPGTLQPMKFVQDNSGPKVVLSTGAGV